MGFFGAAANSVQLFRSHFLALLKRSSSNTLETWQNDDVYYDSSSCQVSAFKPVCKENFVRSLQTRFTSCGKHFTIQSRTYSKGRQVIRNFSGCSVPIHHVRHFLQKTIPGGVRTFAFAHNMLIMPLTTLQYGTGRLPYYTYW